MPDARGNLPRRIASGTLDAATQERLLVTLREELAHASDEALARGMTPEDLAAYLDGRIARLRAHIASL